MLENLVAQNQPIHDLLRKRWSPRAFADRPIELAPLIRRPLAEFGFAGEWDRSADLVTDG